MNDQMAPFFERLARTAPAQKLLYRIGLHPKQFVLFLGLLRTLSEREEYMGLIGADRFAISYLAIFIAILGGLASTTIVISQKVPAPAYLLAHLAIIFVMLCFAIRVIPGMPFSTQVNEQRAVLKTTNMQMFYICAMALVALQYYLWSSWTLAILSGIALAIAAWLVARWAFAELDKEFRWRLHIMKMGPNQMFKELE
jgi:hypothetical protein